ncbi:hypothetical protein C2L64_45260 [Paraburkholderia hospita]|uniref:Uncharacterized protein n=1 Tax=Paraburkholderia hospita TaxID=169430 RepID=A0AAN1MQN9_9BURK|nr:hypothetical protein C2L64_45260 [Paraburkholderia hospita]
MNWFFLEQMRRCSGRGRAMEPGGNDARLTPLEVRVILPDLEERMLVGLFQHKGVHQDAFNPS